MSSEQKFLLCIENRGCDDLEKGKVYRSVPDADAAADGYVRVVDESGEDYLYPEPYFVSLEPPPAAVKALAPGTGAPGAPS